MTGVTRLGIGLDLQSLAPAIALVLQIKTQYFFAVETGSGTWPHRIRSSGCRYISNSLLNSVKKYSYGYKSKELIYFDEIPLSIKMIKYCTLSIDANKWISSITSLVHYQQDILYTLLENSFIRQIEYKTFFRSNVFCRARTFLNNETLKRFQFRTKI